MIVDVTCYAGYRGEETPRRVTFGDRAVEVAAVIDRWHGPDHRYFKVVGDDGATYILRHEPPNGHWRLTLYERGAAAQATPDENRAS